MWNTVTLSLLTYEKRKEVQFTLDMLKLLLNQDCDLSKAFSHSSQRNLLIQLWKSPFVKEENLGGLCNQHVNNDNSPHYILF